MTLRAGAQEVVDGIDGLGASHASLSQKLREGFAGFTQEERSRVIGAVITLRDRLEREFRATSASLHEQRVEDPMSAGQPADPVVKVDDAAAPAEPRPPLKRLLDALDMVPPELRDEFVRVLIRGYFDGLRSKNAEALGIGDMLGAAGVLLVYGDARGIWVRDSLNASHPMADNMRRVLDAVQPAVVAKIDAIHVFKPDASA